MTAAERQKAYRRRQREVESAAYGKPAGQPTPAILKALARQLAQLDDPQQGRYHAVLRDMAEHALGELCARYGLKPRTKKSPGSVDAGPESQSRKMRGN